MNKIAFGEDFFNNTNALSVSVRKKIENTYKKLENSKELPGLNWEKLYDSQNIYSARVDEKYRLICFREDDDDVIIIAYAGNHDDAYNWAQKHRCNIDANGVIGIYEGAAPTVRKREKSMCQGLLLFPTTIL